MTRDAVSLFSSEERDPREIVRQARLAEEAGLDSLWIFDHFHPWLDAGSLDRAGGHPRDSQDS